ncbi:MAG: DUF2249 domain-containing protein [Opitutaceae bacterium]|nr:DUF2249 domain-containing protein [Opitutaceae bacterium]
MASHPHKVRTLDVRPIMADGEHPFELIMKTVAGLKDGQDLLLITPFLPSPLIERLQSDGFSVRPERRADGSWQTQFTRE